VKKTQRGAEKTREGENKGGNEMEGKGRHDSNSIRKEGRSQEMGRNDVGVGQCRRA
jgi:hypothetical protein